MRRRRAPEPVGIEAKLHLAARTEEAATAVDAEPPAVDHDPTAVAGCLSGTAGHETGQLGIDLAQRQAARQQACQGAANHQLLKIKPLKRPGSLGGDQQATPHPVANGCRRHAQHIGHHRHRVESAHSWLIVLPGGGHSRLRRGPVTAVGGRSSPRG